LDFFSLDCSVIKKKINAENLTRTVSINKLVTVFAVSASKIGEWYKLNPDTLICLPAKLF
jgi:hypothetical protein